MMEMEQRYAEYIDLDVMGSAADCLDLCVSAEQVISITIQRSKVMTLPELS